MKKEGRKGSLWRARRGKGHKWRRRKETMTVCPRRRKEERGVKGPEMKRNEKKR